MDDWEFLHKMRERGFSPEEIADAGSSGVGPWEWEFLSTDWIDSQLEDEPEDDADSVEPAPQEQGRIPL